MSEVTTTQPLITRDEDTLRDIASFSDALQVLSGAGVAVHSTEEFGDGFKITEKSTLVGIPFVTLGMKFVDGDFGGKFVVIHAVTEDGRKVIIVDGSTGIKDQALKYSGHGIEAGLMVPRGLVKSDYEYTDDKGNTAPATTYYLS